MNHLQRLLQQVNSLPFIDGLLSDVPLILSRLFLSLNYKLSKLLYCLLLRFGHFESDLLQLLNWGLLLWWMGLLDLWWLEVSGLLLVLL